MSLGSSAEPIGGGSTYLSVVRSTSILVSYSSGGRVWGITRTLLCVDFHLYVQVDAQDDEIRHHIENTDAQKDLRVFKGDFLRDLHHAENDDQVRTIWSKSQLSLRSLSSNSSCEHRQAGKTRRTYIWGLARLKPDMVGGISEEAVQEGVWRILRCGRC